MRKAYISSKHIAQEACPIRFLGTFDTVKVFNDADLNDIGVSSNVYHVRHALALFERRYHFPLERFELPKYDEGDKEERSFQEAWFAGSHGDIGGACEDDGLALYPLQWILSEAQKFGLVLEFNDEESGGIVDPQTLIFPGGNREQKTIKCVNGISVRMHDLSEIHKRAGFNPRISKTFWNTERQIFEDNGLIGQVSSGKQMLFSFVIEDTHCCSNILQLPLAHSSTLRCSSWIKSMHRSLML